jgi:hypothetical protein
VIDIDPELSMGFFEFGRNLFGGNKVANVTNRRQYLIAVAEVLRDCFGLRR